MTKDRGRFGLHGVICTVSIVLAACGGRHPPRDDSGAAEGQVATWGTSDMGFRGMARVKPRPEYPFESVAGGMVGVAVVEVVTSVEGGVDRVEILEAPDVYIRDAVSEALARWEVDPPRDDDGQSVRIQAKLFFYFVIKDKQGLVRSPVEMLQEMDSGTIDRQASLLPQ